MNPMIGLLSIIAIGFFLGMRHATDPDHVIAVSTIVTQQRNIKRAAWIGVFWGLGHTVTVFAVGSAIILFNLVIPVRLGLAMELCVGFMLILLGGWNLRNFTRSLPTEPIAADHDRPANHTHPHSHGDYVHSHQHGHGPGMHSHSPDETPLAAMDRRLGKWSPYQMLRPLIIGIVHGLAGSAAIALLILAGIRNSTWAIIYLLVFGVGTIAGMMLITMSMASALHFAGNRFQAFGRRLSMISGLVSLGFGLLVAYQICVVHGLFGSNPLWTPH
jgi:ABC-type nickel/cobalt efflux system permease component RcnA